ncbi:hypothetical protein MRBLMN1_006314 [Chitinophaga ginsengisegetis]|uniref:hypothetical protein n=1 Tax=Chitinophaga ginsengisegetis TaxID=393003 RepID=UPI0034372392
MKLQGLIKVCAAMLFCLGTQQLTAQQLKLGTNPSLIKQSALLELESKKQALLLTRIADTNQIVTPVNGMIIYLESDNTFRVRANNYWTKLIADGAAIKSINNDFSPSQEIKATYTPGGTFGFATAGGIHNLTIPDASLTAPGFVNYSAQSFKGLKNFTEGLQTYSLRVTNDVSTPIKILGKDASGDVASMTIDNNLSITSGQLAVKNTIKLWNANKIADYDVLFGTAPVNNDVLTFNGTQWIAKAAAASGVTSVGLSLPSMFNVTTPTVTTSGTLTATLNTQNANLVFAGPATGGAAVPTFRALTAADLPANAFIQNTTTTQTSSNFDISGSGVIGTTLTVKGLTPGSIPYVGTGDVISENNGQLFWDATKSLLGVGTGAPVNKVEISGPPTTAAPFSANTSGLRLTNLATATPAAATSKVLSINSTGDVILTDNPATTNWLTGGNVATATQFLGTTNAVDMVVKYNNKELFKGTRGQTAAESGGVDFSAYTLTLFNGAQKFNGHPVIIRANGNDVLAFEDAAGVPRWHWNMLGNGLNFVETNVQDYRLFLQNGGNVGVGTNTPAALLDVNGTAKIGATGNVLNGVYRASNINCTSINGATGTTSLPNNTTATATVTFTVPGATVALGGNVIINPRFDFPFNLRLISSRVSADNTVTAIFVNTTGSAYSLAGTGKRFDITVIQ